MRKALAVVPTIIVLLSGSLLFAKPKEKVFDNSPKQVFDAALRSARERHVVSYVDEAHLMFSFATGRSFSSNGFNCNASVEPLGDGNSKLIINVQNKSGLSMGAGDRMAEKFFDQVGQELAGDPSQTVKEEPAASHVDVPDNHAISRNTLDGDKGTINVVSVPDGADVLVDGEFVGNAPAVLKLSPGKHTVTVKQDGFQSWSKELTVIGGSNTRLNSNLMK
jgi:hypothetical protein